MKLAIIAIASLLSFGVANAQGVDIVKDAEANKPKVAPDLVETGNGSGSNRKANGVVVKEDIAQRKKETHDSTSISDQAPPSIRRPLVIMAQ